MLHFSTGIHHRNGSGHARSQHAGFTAGTITVILAEAIRDHWASVGAMVVALLLVTDLGTNVVLVAPLLAALAVLVNAVLNPIGAEDLTTTDGFEERM